MNKSDLWKLKKWFVLCIFMTGILLPCRMLKVCAAPAEMYVELNGKSDWAEDEICRLTDGTVCITVTGEELQQMGLFWESEDTVEEIPLLYNAVEQEGEEMQQWTAAAELAVTEGNYRFYIIRKEEEEGKTEEELEILYTSPAICVDSSAPVPEKEFYIYNNEEPVVPEENMYFVGQDSRMQFTLSDAISGVKKADIWIREPQGIPQLWQSAAYEEYPSSLEIEIGLPEQGIWEIGISSEDGNGNVSEEPIWVCQIRADAEPPEIEAVMDAPEGEHDFYRKDIGLSLQMKETDSGIKTAGILVDGEEVYNWNPMPKEIFDMRREAVLSADDWQGTHEVVVWCEDRCGNRYQIVKEIKTDSLAPQLELEFEAAAVKNEIYYPKSRKVILRICEENLNLDSVHLWNGQEELFVGTITQISKGCYEAGLEILADGSYELRAECKDLAGNKTDTETMPLFIIDGTRPIVQVTYKDGEYNRLAFGRSRTALITITDTNVDLNTVAVKQIVNGMETDARSSVKVISQSEQSLVVSIPFDQEGMYTWSFQVTDLAGNPSVLWESQEFLLDFTAPELSLAGVEEDSANRGSVNFKVRARDLYLQENSLQVKVYKDGKRISLPFDHETEEGGNCLEFEAIPELKEWDGRYLVRAECSDEAGNSREVQWEFSVNNFGSSVILGKELLAAMEKYYVNKEPIIWITESNPDALTEQTLLLSGELGVKVLKEHTDYTVLVSRDDRCWYQYIYRLNPSVFGTEGAYQLSLHTVDRAGNHLDTRQAAPISFFLDRTGPAIIIEEAAGMETLGNTAGKFRIQITGKSPIREVIFRNGEEVLSAFDRQEVEAANGVFYLTAEKTVGWETLTVEALDAAGNRRSIEAVVSQNRSGDSQDQPERADLESENADIMAETTIERQNSTTKNAEHDEPSSLGNAAVFLTVIVIFICLFVVHFYSKYKKEKDSSC